MITLNGQIIHYQGGVNSPGGAHGAGLPTIRINGSPVAVQSQFSSGHEGFPPSPSVTGSPTIKANGLGIMVAGDSYLLHVKGDNAHADVAAPTG